VELPGVPTCMSKHPMPKNENTSSNGGPHAEAHTLCSWCPNESGVFFILLTCKTEIKILTSPWSVCVSTFPFRFHVEINFVQRYDRHYKSRNKKVSLKCVKNNTIGPSWTLLWMHEARFSCSKRSNRSVSSSEFTWSFSNILHQLSSFILDFVTCCEATNDPKDCCKHSGVLVASFTI